MIAGLKTDEDDLGGNDNPHYVVARLVAALSRFELMYLFQSFGGNVVNCVLEKLEEIMGSKPSELQRITQMFQFFASSSFKRLVLTWGKVEVREPREAHGHFALSVNSTYWPFGQMLSLELFLYLNKEPFQILFGSHTQEPDSNGDIRLHRPQELLLHFIMGERTHLIYRGTLNTTVDVVSSFITNALTFNGADPSNHPLYKLVHERTWRSATMILKLLTSPEYTSPQEVTRVAVEVWHNHITWAEIIRNTLYRNRYDGSGEIVALNLPQEIGDEEGGEDFETVGGRPNGSGSRWYENLVESENDSYAGVTYYQDRYTLNIQSNNQPPQERLNELIRSHHDDQRGPIIRGQTPFNQMSTASKINMLNFSFARLAAAVATRFHNQFNPGIDQRLRSLRDHFLNLHNEIFNTFRRPNQDGADEIEPPLSDLEQAERLEAFFREGYPNPNGFDLPQPSDPEAIYENPLEEAATRAIARGKRLFAKDCRCCPPATMEVKLTNLPVGFEDRDVSCSSLDPIYSPCSPERDGIDSPPRPRPRMYGPPYSDRELQHGFELESTLGGSNEETQRVINSRSWLGSTSRSNAPIPAATTTTTTTSLNPNSSHSSSASSIAVFALQELMEAGLVAEHRPTSQANGTRFGEADHPGPLLCDQCKRETNNSCDMCKTRGLCDICEKEKEYCTTCAPIFASYENIPFRDCISCTSSTQHWCSNCEKDGEKYFLGVQMGRPYCHRCFSDHPYCPVCSPDRKRPLNSS